MGQKGSKIKITETDKAILEIKTSKDQIHRYSKKTNQYIEIEKNELKRLIKENPKNYKKNVKIRLLLKRIHYQECLLQQANDQLINLENMVNTIEFKIVELQFLNGMKNGNEILKKLNKEFINIDELMDNIEEEINYQNEIDNILSKNIVGITLDDELDKELDMIEEEMNPMKKENAKIKEDLIMPSLDNVPEISVKDNKIKEEGIKNKNNPLPA